MDNEKKPLCDIPKMAHFLERNGFTVWEGHDDRGLTLHARYRCFNAELFTVRYGNGVTAGVAIVQLGMSCLQRMKDWAATDPDLVLGCCDLGDG